jgi:hypothetical protein
VTSYEAILSEAQRYQGSPYKKHHEFLFYEAAVNIGHFEQKICLTT